MQGSTDRHQVRVSLGLSVAIVGALAGCGPTHRGPQLPAGATAYAGLRWVPADVSYALVARSTEDAILVVRDLLDSFGLLAGGDASSAGAALAGELGFDPLSATALAAQGVDVTRGLALWSRGVGPSIALPLSDAPAFAAMIEDRRSHGAVVQVAREGGVEVYSWRPDREVSLHWAIVDGWLLAHFELAEEREADLAWFRTAVAAQGAFAAEADFTAARADATRRVGAPALIGLVRMPALFATPFAAGMAGCRDSLGQVGRVFIGAARDAQDSRGSIAAELPGGVDGLRAIQLRQPSGWVAARGTAPIQAEIGVDLREVAPRFAHCVDDDELGREITRGGLHGGRVFVHDLDVGGLKGRGAIAAVGEARTFAELVEDIPAPDFLRKQRRVGSVEVVDIDVPLIPRFSYAFIDTTAIAAVELPIDPLLGALAGPGDELARIEVRPQAWPAATWDQLIGSVLGREQRRKRIVAGLRRWTLGSIIARLDGGAVVIDLHGAR